jgi:predicted short-subunit dehydrogenase-like oxidoreductase (DUF2520 family)
MTTKFEDAVAALKAQHFESPEMVQVLELMVEQNERIKNLEAGNLANKHAVTVLDAASQAHGVSIGSLAQDRNTHAQRLAEVVAAPAADSKKVEDLEKRVTAVEGAVGSKVWKRAEAPKPILPLADPLKPEVEAKPSILPNFMQSKPAETAAV